MIRSTTQVVLAIALALGTTTAAAAQDELTIRPVKDGLYAIFGSGGNVGVRVTPEGVILVDDKYPQNFEEIQRLVARVSSLPVKYVINTHNHY